METTNPTEVTEIDDVQLNEQIDELNKKQDKTEEETNKLGGLKKERSSRYQTKVTHLMSDKKAADYRAETAEEKLKRAEEELSELKNTQVKEVVSPVKETVTIGKEAHYTDRTLRTMVDAGQLNETEAYNMQRARDKAELKEELRQEFKEDSLKTNAQTQAQKDLADIVAQYPQWDPKNADHNPKDELMLEVVDLYNSGVPIKKALAKAKRIVGVKTPIDSSDALSVQSSSAPKKEDKVATPFSSEEEDIAVRTFRDTKNPATGRLYTPAEAIEKAKKAKEKRQALRRT